MMEVMSMSKIESRSRPLATGVAIGIVAFSMMNVPAYAQVTWASVVAYLRNMLREGEAWSMVVSQSSLSAEQVAETYKQSTQQLARAIDLQRKEELLTKVVSDYGAETGQPDSVGCVAHVNARRHVQAQVQAEQDGARLIENFSQIHAKRAMERRREMLERLKGTYCTVSEARQGICTLQGNGMQGWDRNYAGAFSKGTLGPEEEIAAYDYAHMVSVVDGDEIADCEGAACEKNRLDAMRRAAMSSMVAGVLVEQATSRRTPSREPEENEDS